MSDKGSSMWPLTSFVAFLFFAALQLGAHAGLLKYKDENGRLHVVQSVNDIPLKYRPQTNSPFSDKVLGVDRCIGKKACGIFVVYPSYDSVNVYRPWYKNALAHNSPKKECGFKVVIMASGRETKESLDRAQKIYEEMGSGAILDLKGKTLSAYQIRSNMYQFVVDAKGKVLGKGAQAQAWVSENFGGKSPMAPSQPATETACTDPQKTVVELPKVLPSADPVGAVEASEEP